MKKVFTFSDFPRYGSGRRNEQFFSYLSHRSNAGIFFSKTKQRKNNDCCLRSVSGVEGRVGSSLLLLSRSGESCDKYCKNGTLFTQNISIEVSRRMKIFADSFPEGVSRGFTHFIIDIIFRLYILRTPLNFQRKSLLKSSQRSNLNDT
jgi:hypothetical protein